MPFRKIAIPGGSTKFDSGPTVTIIGPSDHPVSITITYNARDISGNRAPLLGELTFLNVLEYRWVSDVAEYYPYDDEDQFDFGLVQIFRSKLIEDMASKGRWRDMPNQRFGPYLDEQAIKHFRIMFDEYGYFDIIALDVHIRSIGGADQ